MRKQTQIWGQRSSYLSEHLWKTGGKWEIPRKTRQKSSYYLPFLEKSGDFDILKFQEKRAKKAPIIYLSRRKAEILIFHHCSSRGGKRRTPTQDLFEVFIIDQFWWKAEEKRRTPIYDHFGALRLNRCRRKGETLSFLFPQRDKIWRK